MTNTLDFIHRFVPAPNASKRVLLLLHGTGGDESDLLSLGRTLDPEAALLSPRGKVLENGAPRFFRRFAEGIFDEEDVIRRANELADFIRAAAVEYFFAIENVIAVGYSNGANIAAAMMLLRPEILREAILFRAMVALSEPPASDQKRTRILISNGAQDPIIAPKNGQRLAEIFRAAGAEVMFELQAANHGLVARDLETARVWLP